MTKREAFLQAVSKEYVEEFLNFVKRSKDRSDPFDLDELLQEFPKKQKEELWENLGKLLTGVLLEFPMEKWNCEIDEDSADEMEVEGSADLKQTMSVIEGVIMVACASIRVIDEDVTYGALLECAIILNAFPVRDPSFDNEVMDSEIQRQFEVLFCMAMVTENKLSHPLLEQLLPALKNSLHDNSEKVRVAFVDLLQKIKAVRAAKFWKVCPMEHLLARLETDSRPVSRRIVNLLFNSFLPVNQSEEVWCERCVTLIQMNPMAARKFYQYAHEHTAPTNIGEGRKSLRTFS
ncbi:UNVERIFIED_CONTAM: hypothetical protein FKN15_002729 [Acipenser sinensis]